MSSDEEVTGARRKKFVVDSSDENEENNLGLIKPDINILKEDSEEDNNIDKQPALNRKMKKTRCLKAFESDSDSEGEMPFPTTKLRPTVAEFDGINVNQSSQRPIVSDSSSVSEFTTNTSNVEKSEEIPKKTWYKNTDLFEAYSTDEEDKEFNTDKDNKHSDDDEGSKLKSKNKRSLQFQRKERASKKKAQNEIQEIHKESQRMLRETQVSIPYHRPKQHTLAEFLGRRKETPIVPLRTSADQLAPAWRAIEEREKEAESFYKSESEEESFEEEGPSYKPKEKSDDKNNQETGSATDVSCENTSGSVENTVFQIEKERSAKNAASNCADLDNCIDDSVEKSLISSDSDVIYNRCSNEKQQLFTKHLSYKTDDSICDEMENSVVENKNHVDNPEKNVNGNLNSEHTTNQESFVIKNQNFIDQTMDESKLEKPEETKCDDGNVRNTEEFSLRMSESQSDLETGEAVSKSDELNPACTIDGFKKCAKTHQTKPINSENEGGTISNISFENQEKENNKISLNGESCSHGHEIEENKQPNLEDININDAALNQNLNDHIKYNNMDNILRNKYNLKPGQPSYGPKINGSLDEDIEFEESEVNPGFDGLMKRFYAHLSYKKKPLKKKTPLELSIVSAETDSTGQVNSISNEVVKVLVGDEEEEQDPSLSKPGAKLTRLRAHLRAEMERKREQEWAKKQQEQRLYEDEIYEEEKDVCDGFDEEKEDDAKEDQQSEEEESESEEEEEEVGDAREEKKERKKSGFIDDEAEESDADISEERGDDSSDSFIKRPKQKRIILQRQNTEDMFVSQEVLKSSNNEEEEFPSFQKPLPLEEKAYETEESETSVCPSPAFRLTALEGKENHSFNWSEPSTPCKDIISPKTVTPVRARIAPLVDKSPQVGSQDLENLCSGQFVSQPLQDNEENNTQDFQLFLVEDSQMSQDQSTPVKVTKITQYDSDGKDRIRSLMVDDNDDNDELSLNGVNKNKKVAKLNFSDDEEEENTQPLENNLGESDGDSDESAVEDRRELTAADEVAYDSEENEVVKAAGDFLDVEAELSESEWDSADEDERGLDALETEEADREDIDQRKLKRELEQMHMKQVMKDDNRDVKLLQEMFCEDGDLQSDRQRQRLFRWSNNGTDGDDGNRALIDSDEEKAEDDEDEENWRKSRHEREQFLKELQNKKKNNQVEIEIEIEESDSQLMKLGRKAIKRMSQETKLTPPLNSLDSPNTKQPFNKCTKRGSFLSRAPQMLSRLAQMTAACDGPVNGPKNSRNFLFTSVSPTKDKVEMVPIQQNNKRKMPVIPLPVAKRPCVHKPKMANKKSLFDSLFKVPS